MKKNFDLSTKEGRDKSALWLKNMLRMLNNEAIWVVPRSGTTVFINKPNKTVEIAAGFAPDDAIAQVFELVGYKVLNKGE